MKYLPLKTRGMYYCVEKDTDKKPKLNKIWDVLTNQFQSDGNVYHIVFCGKTGILSEEEEYFIGINLAILTNDFKTLARNYLTNDYRYNEYDENCFVDINFEKDNLSFENKLWKCSGKINDTILVIYFRNKKTGHSFNMRFNYYLPDW